MEKKKTKNAWLKKFGYAFRGIWTSLKEESSLIVHIIVATIMIAIASILQVLGQMNAVDWAITILLIGIIIGMELINTAIENLVDMLSFKYNYNAKKIKDVSAAATLILAISAIAVGLLIYIPKIIAIFGG